MKQLTLWLTLLLTPTLALLAAKPGSPSAAATLTVSCTVCTAGDTITVSGSGFAKRSSVTITLSGAINGTSFAVTDTRGRFSVGYVLGTAYPAGQYEISASQGGTFVSTDFNIK